MFVDFYLLRWDLEMILRDNKRTYPEHLADVDPVRHVLFLRLLGKTDDRKRIVDLLERALQMQHVRRVPAEDVRLP